MTTVTTDDIRRKVADILDVPEAKVSPDAVLTDLVTDSFRLVELAIELQEHYDVLFGQEDMKDLHTVHDLAALVSARVVE